MVGVLYFFCIIILSKRIQGTHCFSFVFIRRSTWIVTCWSFLCKHAFMFLFLIVSELRHFFNITRVSGLKHKCIYLPNKADNYTDAERHLQSTSQRSFHSNKKNTSKRMLNMLTLERICNSHFIVSIAYWCTLDVWAKQLRVCEFSIAYFEFFKYNKSDNR